MKNGKLLAFIGMAIIGGGLLIVHLTKAQSVTPFQCGQVRNLVSGNQPSGSGGVYVSAGGTRIGKILSGSLQHDSYTSTNGIGNSVPSGIVKIGSGNATGASWDFWMECGDGQMVQVYMPYIGAGYALCVASDGSTYYAGSEQTSCSTTTFTSANLRRANDGTGSTVRPAATPLPDTTVPVLNNVLMTNRTDTTATYTWDTNEASDTQAEYGLTTSYGTQFPGNAALGVAHTLTLTGLTAGTTYYIKVKSVDAAGNVGMYSSSVATLPPPFNFTLHKAAGAVENKAGTRAKSIFKIENTYTVAYDYRFSCTTNSTAANQNPLVQVVTDAGVFVAAGSNVNVPVGSSKYFEYSFDIGTATPAGTVSVNCNANRTTATADDKYSYDTVSVIAPVAGTNTPSSAALTQLFPGQYSNTKFSIKISDEDGLKEFSVKKVDGTFVYSGSPGAAGNTGSCTGTAPFKSVDSGTVTLQNSDFPLTATVIDCKSATTYASPANPNGGTPTTCAAPQVLCPATSTYAAYCATTCGSTSNANWVKHVWNFSDGQTVSSSILNRTDKEYTDFIASVDAACKLIPNSKFTWKSDAGNDAATNWRNFGIPDCGGTAVTACAASQVLCPATSTSAAYCAATCGTTVLPPGTGGDPRSCGANEKCPKGSWCSGSGMQCYYPDSQMTCTPWSNTPSVSTDCPVGTSVCDPTNISCVAPGQVVPYVSGKYCTNGQAYYSTDGKNMTCVKWTDSVPSGYSSCRSDDTSCIPENSYGPSTGYCNNGMKCYQKTDDKNAKNDLYCAKMSPAATMPAVMPVDSVTCPADYSFCSPTDNTCKQKGDLWTGTENNASGFYCMSSQKCSTSSGGGQCVGWSETCPSGTLYCSSMGSAASKYSKCGEPDMTTDLNIENAGGFWCGGGGGQALYNKALMKGYCPAKKPSGAPNYGMFTGLEVKALLDKLGAGWQLCNPFSNPVASSAASTGTSYTSGRCLEPGQSGSSMDWCAWNPSMSGTMPYASPAIGSSRTCPSLDGSITPPPGPVTDEDHTSCSAMMYYKKNGIYVDENGAPAPAVVSRPGYATEFKSFENGKHYHLCDRPIVKPPEKLNRCEPGQLPTPDRPCSPNYYRWSINEKKFEVCADDASTSTYFDVLNDTKATYTMCMAIMGNELEWKKAKFLARPPVEFGTWYWPAWDTSTPQTRYDSAKDDLVACSSDEAGRVYAAADMFRAPDYPCSPTPEKDRSWMLLKARAEHEMSKLYRRPAPGEPVIPGKPLPVPPVIMPELPPIPTLPGKQCKSYLANSFGRSISGDKQFWKNIRVQMSQAEEDYVDAEAVNKLLDDSKAIIIEVEKAVRAGKCTSELLQPLQDKLNILHGEIFPQLSNYQADLQDFADFSTCKDDLAQKFKHLSALVKGDLDDEEKNVVNDVIKRIEEKLGEFEGREGEGIFDLTFDCRELNQELQSQIAPFFLSGDRDIKRVVDDVVNKKLAPVLEALTKQIEERGKKIEELTVEIARLTTEIEKVSASATGIAEKLTVSYASLSRIEEKFSEQKTQIQSAKDRLIPLIEKAVVLIGKQECVGRQYREPFIATLGNVVSENWVGDRADELEKRLNSFITSCNAKQVSANDIETFTNSYSELSTQNLADSYKQGLTPFPDVPTNTWYYGGMVTCADNGYMTKGLPAENVLRQDALLMALRASGATDADLNSSDPAGCSLKVPGISSISSYAKCAANYGASKGVALGGGAMTVPVSRHELAGWLIVLLDLPRAAADETLVNYTDLRGLPAGTISAIGKLVANEIMVGQVGDEASTWKPYSPLTRSELAVVLEKILKVRGELPAGR